MSIYWPIQIGGPFLSLAEQRRPIPSVRRGAVHEWQWSGGQCCAQIPWSMKELWAAEQSSPGPVPEVGHLSRRSGRGQGGASRGEQSPVQPCLGWGRAVTNQPIIQLLLNQKFIFKQCSGFQDHSRLFRSRQYYIAGLSTPNRDSLQLLAFKQLILQKPSCHSLNFSTFNSSKILSRPHLNAHCCTWSFEGYSERQTSTGWQVSGTQNPVAGVTGLLLNGKTRSTHPRQTPVTSCKSASNCSANWEWSTFVWETFASHLPVNGILFYEFITMLFKHIFRRSKEALLFLFLRKGIRVNT